MNFWDSSAFVPLLVEEPRSAKVRRVAAEDADLVYWWTLPVECWGGLWRLNRENVLSVPQLMQAARQLDTLLERGACVEPAEAVRAGARRLLAGYPLRSADALHLSAALVGFGGTPHQQGFVCLDARLRDAAFREGFRVLPADL